MTLLMVQHNSTTLLLAKTSYWFVLFLVQYNCTEILSRRVKFALFSLTFSVQDITPVTICVPLYVPENSRVQPQHSYLFVIIQSIINDLRKFTSQFGSFYKISSSIVFSVCGRRCLSDDHNIANIIIIQFIVRIVRPLHDKNMYILELKLGSDLRETGFSSSQTISSQQGSTASTTKKNKVKNDLPVFIVFKFPHGNKFLIEFKI